MAEQLSTKALTVYEALLCAGPELQLRLAASIEALADQVVPDQQEPATSPHMGNFVSHAQWFQRQVIRHQLLAIAAELRGDTTTPTETP